MGKKITTKEYINTLKSINSKVMPIEDYIKASTYIKHKCIKCGSEINTSPNKVMEYTKNHLNICQCCSGKRLYVGKNDLWTTDPDIAKMLKNPKDGYKLTRRSDKKADWICPDCGCEIRQKTVNNTTQNGLICPLCGNTRSLGHRLVNSVLNELKISFLNEKVFHWSQSKVYDIYVKNKNCIIEINGIQHYEECGFNELSGKTLADEIENDNYKKYLAFSNGIENYIYIDARESNIDFIIQSIISNTKFNELFDIRNISWNNVVSNALSSNVLQIKDLYNQGKSVPEIQKIVHMSDTVIQRKLHELTKYGLCNYKGSEEMFKPVICLNTLEEFNNLQEAGKVYNIDANGISFVCRGLRNRKTAGKLKDGTKLVWLFKEDYDSKSEDEIKNILDKATKKPVGNKRVICLNTEEVFESIKQAQQQYPDAKSISDCCGHIARSSGKHPITHKKLKWRYYDEYITLSKKEIKTILDDIFYDDKRVICLNTLEIFENATIAAKWCGVNRSGICNCTAGKTLTNGKHPNTGESLRWMKYLDYLKSTTSSEVSA